MVLVRIFSHIEYLLRRFAELVVKVCGAGERSVRLHCYNGSLRQHHRRGSLSSLVSPHTRKRVES